jgi:ABC-type glycerol-3-phosphate transport system permease component
MMTTTLRQIDFVAIEAKERAVKDKRWIAVIFAALVSMIWIIPFYYMAVSIFKTHAEYAANDPLSLPGGFSPIVDNVISAWNTAKMGAGFANSAFYGLVGSGLAVFFAAMAAYGLTRMNFKHQNFWFMLIFAGTIFPFQIYLIPLFFAYQKIGIINTHFGMLLFYTAVCVPFPVLVLRNYLNGLSREMDEAARIDGASEFRVFWSIILPNCIGPMTATFLLQFTWIWNDLLFSTVLGNRDEVRSIMNSLQIFHGSYTTAGPNLSLTAALIASLPAIILFLLLRRHFMEGMRVTSL